MLPFARQARYSEAGVKTSFGPHTRTGNLAERWFIQDRLGARIEIFDDIVDGRQAQLKRLNLVANELEVLSLAEVRRQH